MVSIAIYGFHFLHEEDRSKPPREHAHAPMKVKWKSETRSPSKRAAKKGKELYDNISRM